MSAGVVEDQPTEAEGALSSAPTRFPRLMKALDLLNSIGSIWIVGLMVITCTDAILRTFFARPISGVSEFTALSIVGIVFLQLAATCLRGKLTNSDLITGMLDHHRPRAGAVLKALYALVGAVTFLALSYVSLPAFLAALAVPEYTGVSGLYKIPLLPFRLLIVAGAFLTSVTFFLRFISFLRDASRTAPNSGGPIDV